MMNYAELKKANEEMKTIEIKRWDKEKKCEVVKQYPEVAQRVEAFRKVETNGAIITELISYVDGICMIKATVYDSNGKILAVGHAREDEAASAINKSGSCMENCETSAVGRALAFCGFGSASSIASAEEIRNAEEEMARQERIRKDSSHLDAKLLEEADDLHIDLGKVATYLKKDIKDMTNIELADCIARKRGARLQ